VVAGLLTPAIVRDWRVRCALGWWWVVDVVESEEKPGRPDVTKSRCLGCDWLDHSASGREPVTSQ
jgi:hypothetical protein